MFVLVALIAFTARLAAAEPNAEGLDDDVPDARSAPGDSVPASFKPVGSDSGVQTSRDPAARVIREQASFDPAGTDANEQASFDSAGSEGGEQESWDRAESDAGEGASFDPAWSDAGAAEEREVARHTRPTRIGRVDLTVMWRRTVRVAEIRGAPGRDDDAGGGESGRENAHARYGIASPLDPVTKERGVLWVLLTWSR